MHETGIRDRDQTLPQRRNVSSIGRILEIAEQRIELRTNSGDASLQLDDIDVPRIIRRRADLFGSGDKILGLEGTRFAR